MQVKGLDKEKFFGSWQRYWMLFLANFKDLASKKMQTDYI